MAEQIAIPCAVIRGGTSKGVFFKDADLPRPGPLRDRVIKRAMGTPDELQIDGLGGSRLITSKVAVIRKSDRSNADVEFDMMQVEVARDYIDHRANCGNISVGVGPFAIDEGMVEAVEPVTTVRIYNTNTDTIIVARVPVLDGRARITGEFAIPGVPGSGAEISVDLSDTVGSGTGRLLPTGNAADAIRLEDGRTIEITLCDVGNPAVYVSAADVGMSGIETAEAISADTPLLARLREVRGKGAALMGFCSDWTRVDAEASGVPPIKVVAAPQDYVTPDGTAITAAEHDVSVRYVFFNRCHESMAGTGSVNIGAACNIPGAVPHRALRPGHPGGAVRFAHPRGVMTVGVAKTDDEQSGLVFTELSIGRTARRIMDGTVYVPATVMEPAEPAA